MRVLDQRLAQHLGTEQVIAHRRERAAWRARHLRRIVRLLDEARNAQPRIDLHDAELIRFIDIHRQRRDGNRSLALHVKLDHLLDIHPVDMVRAEHRDQVGLGVVDQIEILKNRIRGALVPQLAHPHLRRDWDDKVVGQHPAELPSVLEMLDQRLRAPLHQNVDRVDARVDEIGENEIDDAIFAAERHRRFGAIAGQRMQPRSLPPGHH